VQERAASSALRAYDASNLDFEIYNSDQADTRDTLDMAAKFAIPLVVNGKVFVAQQQAHSVRAAAVTGSSPMQRREASNVQRSEARRSVQL
jgi:hypothetical protein